MASALDEKTEKNRCPDEGGEDPDGEFGGGDEVACADIGEEKKAGTPERAGREEEAVVGPDSGADHMWGDESDEADASAEGNGGADDGGGEEDEPTFDARDVNPEVDGFLFAEEEGVEGAGKAGQDEEGNEDEEEGGEEEFPVGTPEGAETPEGEGAEFLVGGDKGHEADNGTAESVDGDTDEEHGNEVDLTLRDGKAVDEEGHEDGSNHGGEGNGIEAEGLKEGGRQQSDTENDHEDSANGTAARDPDDARVGEGIAENALHGGTGHGKTAADEDGENDAGKADIPDNNGFGMRDLGKGRTAEFGEEDGGNFVELQFHGPGGEPDQDGKGDEEGEEEEQPRAQGGASVPLGVGTEAAKPGEWLKGAFHGSDNRDVTAADKRDGQVPRQRRRCGGRS